MGDEAAGGGLQLWRVRCVCARSFPPSHARLSSIASLRDSTEHCTAWLRDPISCEPPSLVGRRQEAVEKSARVQCECVLQCLQPSACSRVRSAHRLRARCVDAPLRCPPALP